MLLNLACVKCHLRKKQCDGRTPCGPCTEAGADQQCVRLPRKKRSSRISLTAGRDRRRHHHHRGETSPITTTTTTTNSPSDLDAAEQSLSERDGVRREDMERSQVWQMSRRNATESVRREGSASTEETDSHVRPAFLQFTLIDFSPDSAVTGAEGDGWEKLPLQGQSESTLCASLLASARQCLISPAISHTIIRDLFYWRVMASIHSCIHIPTIHHSIDAIFSDIYGSGHDAVLQEADEICLCLIVVALGLQALPRCGRFPEATALVEQLNLHSWMAASAPSHARHLAQLARTYILQQCQRGPRPSLPYLQAICCLLIFDADGMDIRALLNDHAIRCARLLRVDQITTYPPVSVEEEMGVRIWWFLVCRDWLGAISQKQYSIHYTHFTSRLPAEMSDEELKFDHLQVETSRRVGAYLPVRYSLAIISLSKVVRELIDCRLGSGLSQAHLGSLVVSKMETLCVQLPADFSLRNSSRDVLPLSSSTKLVAERWLLHQQIFFALFELSPVEPGERVPDVLLSMSEHILEIRDDVARICSIVDSFRVKVTNVAKACTILLNELLRKGVAGHLSSISRDITLRRVNLAILECHKDGQSVGDVFGSLQRLMRSEAERWRARCFLDGCNGEVGSGETGDYPGHASNVDQQPAISEENIGRSILKSSSDLLSLATGLDGTARSDNLNWIRSLPEDVSASPLFLADSTENSRWNAFYDMLDSM